MTSPAIVREALRECQDKLWIARCDSRDEAFREVAEKACRMATEALAALAALDATPGEGEWRTLDDYPPHQPVLVSRPTDKQIYRPTTAFLDATGVWRVFRSEGGMCVLPFEPTHWKPTPEPPLSGSVVK